MSYVPGLEARHRWDDRLTLNELGVIPEFDVDEITGLQMLADIADSRANATSRQGEIPLTTFRRGKTITYSGTVKARSMPVLRQAQADFLGAFGHEDERRMDITHHPDYAEGSGSFFFWARPTMADSPERQTASPNRRSLGYERPFTVALRLSDGRIYGAQLVTVTTGALASSGGIAPPFIPPVTPEAAGGSAGAVTVNVGGNADTEGIFDIWGPVRNPRIENETIDRELRLTDLYIPTGQFVRVDFRNRMVLLGGETDLRIKLDLLYSDWWDVGVPCLIPGENTIRLRGSNMVDPARIVVSFYPAYR